MTPYCPGHKIGNYEIRASLGSGATGEVYRAWDPRTCRDVAIKVLRRGLAGEPEHLKRFRREAWAAAAPAHPNVATIYELGSDNGHPYLAMELVEGRTLREIIDGGKLAVADLIRIAIQIAEGLSKAHDAGIVHRDLKPENVMVTPSGRVKILDFGLAKPLLPVIPLSARPTTFDAEEALTVPGSILGTVDYMSPEQARGESVDGGSDQFSLGAILYELATGVPAFNRGSLALTLKAIRSEEPTSLTSLNQSLPGGLVKIVHTLLAKDRQSRFSSMTEVAKALAGLRRRSRKPRRATRWSWRHLWTVAGLVIARR